MMMTIVLRLVARNNIGSTSKALKQQKLLFLWWILLLGYHNIQRNDAYLFRCQTFHTTTTTNNNINRFHSTIPTTIQNHHPNYVYHHPSSCSALSVALTTPSSRKQQNYYQRRYLYQRRHHDSSRRIRNSEDTFNVNGKNTLRSKVNSNIDDEPLATTSVVLNDENNNESNNIISDNLIEQQQQQSDRSTTRRSNLTTPTVIGNSNSIIAAPTVGAKIRFAIPAMGIWLCNPLLSMIDTAVVGLLSGTIQQAALNPATAVTDYSARTLSFLYTGITNIMATSAVVVVSTTTTSSTTSSAYSESTSSTEIQSTKQRFFSALQLSFVVGTGLGLLVYLLAPQMLQLLIGNNPSKVNDIRVYQAAINYVRICAMGMPATAMIGTSQAACLGMKDVRSPFLLVVIASLVNFILDLVFVPLQSSRFGGAAGAAVATTISQYVAISLFIRHLKGSNKNDKTADSITDSSNNIIIKGSINGNTKTIVTTTKRFIPLFLSNIFTNKTQRQQQQQQQVQQQQYQSPTAGYLQEQMTIRQFFGTLPDRITVKKFIPYVVPVTTTQIGRCSTYIAMGHVISSCFGTVSMAANQIITSIFYALVPIGDSLSLTAQSLLPSILTIPTSSTTVSTTSDGNNETTTKSNKSTIITTTIMNFLKAATGLGGFLALLVASIPLVCPFFTTDTAVLTLVQQLIPMLLLIFGTHGIFCAAEGILLANRDLSFLGRMYALYFVIVPFCMLQIKQIAIMAPPSTTIIQKVLGLSTTVNLSTVWNMFLKYQMVRITVWVFRVGVLLRRQRRKDDTSSLTTEQNT